MMGIYEIINEKKYLENDISLYLNSEVAEELIDEIHENVGYVENYHHYEDTLYENDVVIMSRLKGANGWFVEPLSYDGIKQVINETDICLIQSEIFENIDLGQVEYEELVMLVGLEDEEEADLLDDVATDILNALDEMEDDECPHCIIKERLKAIKGTTLDEVIDEIGNLYRKIN